MDKKTRKAQVVLTVLDPDRQSFLFLLLQTNEKRGSFWQNVTGKVEENETYEEGALREAIEETGLKIEAIIDIVDLGLGHEFIDQHERKVHEKSFLIVLEKPWPVQLDPKEHSHFRWVALEELERDCVKYTGNFEAIEKARQLLKHWGA